MKNSANCLTNTADFLSLVETLQPQGYEHDALVIEALKEAAQAAQEGNYGIGAIIMDANGQIIARGHNRVFYPHYRSCQHAEFDVLDAYEELCSKQDRSAKGDVLITTLEPCPMCYSRIISSKINIAFYAAPDELGGMVHLKHQMPQVWQNIAYAQGLICDEADCSPELKELALEAFSVTRVELDAKLSKG